MGRKNISQFPIDDFFNLISRVKPSGLDSFL